MQIIGRKDKIDLPELGLEEIEAKIDTGAYGSALHCHKIEVKQKNGRDILTYKLLDPSHPSYENRILKSEVFNQKTVRSSNGLKENRFTIKTKIIVFNKTYNVEFSLTDRKGMKNPILLGRKFLTKRFLVDVNSRDLSHKQKKLH